MPKFLALLAVGIHLGMAMDACSAADSGAVSALRSSYASLEGKSENSQFQEPLYLNSVESSANVRGEIYARIDYPLTTVSAALSVPANWCEVMILHVNTKYCKASTAPAGGTLLLVYIGAKYDQPLKEAYPVEFVYRRGPLTPDYFRVQLSAAEGPLGTRDYRIVLEATSVGAGETFLHLSYSYGAGFAARMAMKAYLATIGRGKVGFTVVDTSRKGQPTYINGVRALVERNTIRYYLAINAYLKSLSEPANKQFEKRLQYWFSGAERYPRQLHEMDEATYFAVKRSEYQRQKQ